MNIIVDIDGTIADCRHRIHLVKDGNKDWKSFFELMTKDKPIEPVIDLISLMHIAEYSKIYLVTGRPEEYRMHTKRWMIEHDVFYNELYMRADGDYRPDYIVKEEILNSFKAKGITIDLAIDDKQEVVDMWRRNGIICLQNSMREMP